MKTQRSYQFQVTSSEPDIVRCHCPLCNTAAEVVEQSGPQDVDCENCGLHFMIDPSQVDPSSNEPTSSALAEEPRDELQRWLAGEPIQERPATGIRRLRRWCRNHPFKAALSSALLVALFAGIGVLSWTFMLTTQALAEQNRENERLVQAHRQARRELERKLEIAETRRKEAVARHERARREAHSEMARYLTQQSQQFGSRSPQLSMELAAEALKITRQVKAPIIREAHQVLRDGLLKIDGKQLRGHGGKIISVAVSPDSRWLASGSVDRTAYLWDLKSADPSATPTVLRGHESHVSAVEFTRDRQWLVTGSSDSTVRLWNMKTGDPSQSPVVLRGNRGRIGGLAVSRDSRWLVTAGGGFTLSDSAAFLFDLESVDSLRKPVELTGHRGQIRVVAISPNNRWVISGGEDGAARLWDLTALRPAVTPIILSGHQGRISAAVFSPDSRWLATSGGFSSQDFGVRLWDLSEKVPDSAIVLGGHQAPVEALAIGPQGRWLVTASVDGVARAWDLTAADPAARSISLRGPARPIQIVAISPKANWIISGNSDGTVHLWGLDSTGPSEMPVVLSGHRGRITSLATSPDGHWLVSAGEDSSLRLWSLRIDELIQMATNAQPLRELDAPRRLANRLPVQTAPAVRRIPDATENVAADFQDTHHVMPTAGSFEAAPESDKITPRSPNVEQDEYFDPLAALYENWVKQSEVARSKDNSPLRYR